MRIFSLFSLIILIALPSCEWINSWKSEKVILAKAGSNELYLADVQWQFSKEVSKEDSLQYIESYANDWIKEQLLLEQAALNIEADMQAIDKKVREYRNSLVIYAYEKAFVQQKLDTIVSNVEIEKYYANNQKEFELKDYIVKINYVKLAHNAPKKDVLENELFYKIDNKAFLEEYCLQFAANYSLEDDVWLYFDELLREVPIKTFDVENFLRRNERIKIEDEDYLYLVKIVDHRLKDAVSPLDFEKNKIRNIIINQRKITLISNLHKDILKDAFAVGKAEILLP